MIWLAMKKAGAPGWSPWQDVVLVLCDIVEPLTKGLADSRSLAAIEDCRAFVAGKMSRSSLLKAADAADAAADAAYAADADARAAYAAARAADAVYAANAAACAAHAAHAHAHAAHARADAADVATAAAADAVYAANAAACAAKDTALAEMADLVRDRLTLGEL
jgi:hypothetical protein